MGSSLLCGTQRHIDGGCGIRLRWFIKSFIFIELMYLALTDRRLFFSAHRITDSGGFGENFRGALNVKRPGSGRNRAFLLLI
jgi:hypothetical protein